MAAKPPPSEPIEQDPVELEPEIILNEFCQRLSERDRRFMLISGFHRTCTKANRQRDTASAFQSAFDAYCVKPSGAN